MFIRNVAPEDEGVFQDDDALAGTEAFNVYGANGRRLGRWTAAVGVTDEMLLEAFSELLKRKRTRLRIIPASHGTST